MADYNYLARGIGPALQEGAQAAYMAQHGDYWNARAGMYGQPGMNGQGGNPFAHLPVDTQKHLANVAGWVGDETGAILQAPEADQPALYAAALQRAKAQGIPGTETWPQQWGPDAKNFAVLNRAHAAHVTEWLAPQKAPKVGRGGGGGGAPGDGLEPMASAAPPGGDTAVADAGPSLAAPPTQTAQMLAAPQAAPPPGPSETDVADVAPVGGAAPPNAGGYGAGEPPEIGAGEGFGAGAQAAPPPDMGALGPPGAALQSQGGARPQGNIWNTDPGQYGGVMMGHRTKGGPLLPAEIGGHFVYKLPPDGEHPQGQTILYKPEKPASPPDKFKDIFGPDGVTRIGQTGPDNKYYPINQKPLAQGIPPEMGDVHGQEYLDWLKGQNPAKANLVNSIIGQKPGFLPSDLSKRTDFNELMGHVLQAQPDYDPTGPGQRRQFEMNLAKASDPNAATLSSANTAINHARIFRDLTEAMQNGDMPLVNTIVNEAKKQFGNANVPSAEIARDLYGEELVRAVKGGGQLNEAQEQQMRKNLSINAAPEAMQQELDTLTGLMQGRVHTVEDTARRFGVPESRIKEYISPRSRETLDYMQSNPLGKPKAEGAAAPVTATNPATGEKLMLQGGQWVPLK